MKYALVSEKHATKLASSIGSILENAQSRCELSNLNPTALQEEALGAAYLWRSDKNSVETMAWLLECLFTISFVTLGMMPYRSQARGILAILSGQLAEMQTGEGKSLVAALSAATYAITGRTVHVATVNDYLAERDYQEFIPLFSALKISHSLIKQSLSEHERKTAYRQAVVYASGRELIFDHLRDIMEVGHRSSRAQSAVKKITARNTVRPIMDKLDCCIVDEADSVLIDEASTPCVISLPTTPVFSPTELFSALEFAERLDPKKDLDQIGHRTFSLSESGEQFLQNQISEGAYPNHLMARELLRFAITAKYSLQLDHDYVVVDGKIGLVDKLTGRISTERSYQTGLQQLIELKEGLELSPTRDNAGRLTYQQFFKKYRTLSGMTGTAKEVARELRTVYSLRTKVIPTNSPDAKVCVGYHVCKTQEDKLEFIVRQCKSIQAQGQPILIGADSIEFAQQISAKLEHAKLSFDVVDGLNDDTEATVIAKAGISGAITVATPVAGRGTDIKIDPEARNAGGLHVLLSSLQFSQRIDRQFIGRAGRQGDPGTYSVLISHEDPVWNGSKLSKVRHVLPDQLQLHLIRQIQRSNETVSRKYRKRLVRQEEKRMQQMAFRKKR